MATWLFKFQNRGIVAGEGDSEMDALRDAVRLNASSIWPRRSVTGDIHIAEPTRDGLHYIGTTGNEPGYRGESLIAASKPGWRVEIERRDGQCVASAGGLSCAGPLPMIAMQRLARALEASQ